MDNALTIDVEDYYMVSAFADRIRFEDWESFPSRVDRNTRVLLDLLDEQGVQATFFVLGWVAERHPGLVRDLRARGHEIACHGYNHRLIYDQTPQQFRDDVRRSKDVLEDLTGRSVAGFRATSYSIVSSTLWALDILIEEGFRYDSSIFPVHHDRYGLPGAPRFSHTIRCNSGAIDEFPPTTYRLLGQNIPVAGGGYLRLYPLAATTEALRRINEREQQPAIVYVHPWEIDPEQPRMTGSRVSLFRHYVNLGTTLPKLRALLSRFPFRPLGTFQRAERHAEAA